MLKKVIGAKHTPWVKQEAVHMAKTKGCIVEVARTLGVPEQTLFISRRACTGGALLQGGKPRAKSSAG